MRSTSLLKMPPRPRNPTLDKLKRIMTINNKFQINFFFFNVKIIFGADLFHAFHCTVNN